VLLAERTATGGQSSRRRARRVNKRLLMYVVFGEEYRIACEKKDYVPDDETLTRALDRLTEREKHVIQCRFAESRLTVKQTAAGYPRHDGGVGPRRERIPQGEASALRRLELHNTETKLWKERPIMMITVHFEDHGQDFLEWDLEDGKVVDCRPFQAWLWNGSRVHSTNIRPGLLLDITTKSGGRTRLRYPIERVEEKASV